MPVGLFGAVIFQADLFLVKSMKRKTSNEWTDHKILNQMPISQNTGGELGEFSCIITFNSRHTLPFEAGLALLESYCKQGLHFPLVIGYQLIGGFTDYNYVIRKVEADYNITNNHGFGLHSSVNVDFKQYRTNVGSSGGSNGLFGELGGALSGALNAVSGIPGVSSVINGVQGTIGQLTSATQVSGVSTAINSAMSSAGKSVNGITSGGMSGSLSGMTSMLGQGASNAVSLSFGGGVE